MTTFIILSRFSPEAVEDPKDFKKLAETVSNAGYPRGGDARAEAMRFQIGLAQQALRGESIHQPGRLP